MNKSESTKFSKEFEKRFQSSFPLKTDKHFLLGVSGGSDSMVLLYLFKKLDIKATIVHCNYQMRGDSSEKDQQLVEEICSMWNFDCISMKFDPPESGGINFQNWARDKRYQAFRDLKKEEQADAIVLAHHMDDQLETILQKILRGAGLDSWKGMRVWDGELLRPLLQFSKNEILEYAANQNIPYRLDSSNSESTYSRNFLRNSWFPIMYELFPGWKKNILKIPDRAAEFDKMSLFILEQCLREDHIIDREQYLQLPVEIQPVIIHKFIKKNLPGNQLTTGALSDVTKLNELQSGKSIQLGKEIHIRRDRETFILQTGKMDPHEKNKEFILEFEKLENEEQQIDNLKIVADKWDGNIQNFALQIDVDSVQWPLKIRYWKDGDRIQPLGMERNHQLVSDLLTNKKIKSSQKYRARILESFDGKVSAVIFPHLVENHAGVIADWAKCKKETKQVLTLQNSGVDGPV